MTAGSDIGDPPATGDPVSKMLEVRNLQVVYRTLQGDVSAVRNVGFDLERHELLGLVGESGCGKTTAAMTLLRLLPQAARIVGGEAILDQRTDLLALNDEQLRDIRWRELALIPQGAMNSLNPMMRVRDQVIDGYRPPAGDSSVHRSEIVERAAELFSLVGLARRALALYPHELSGGMKQRVCIAMALVNNPSLLVADEPTSALDVNVQRLVAQTLLDVKEQMGTSMIVIGHDMGLLAQLADRVAVMYAGTIMEIGPVDEVLRTPSHPYTRLLMDAVPEIGSEVKAVVTEGITHDLRNPPPGCAFQDRCPAAAEVCRTEFAPVELGNRHSVSCVRLGDFSLDDLWTSETSYTSGLSP